MYLDPHIVRPAPKLNQEHLDTYHCNIPRTMPFELMDPSLALGFYCNSQSDFDMFCSEFKKVIGLCF